jgi:H+/gluconate symporter-like permease
MVVILLSCAVGLMVLLLVLVLGIFRRLARIERRLAADMGRSELGESAPSLAETSAGGAFETFLNEDPARRALSKGEQFAAYRRWRQAKGLNWSSDGG